MLDNASERTNNSPTLMDIPNTAAAGDLLSATNEQSVDVLLHKCSASVLSTLDRAMDSDRAASEKEKKMHAKVLT